MGNKQGTPTLYIFFVDCLKRLALLTFSSGKFGLSSPKIMFLDAYSILYSHLLLTRSAKSDNQHAKIMDSLASNLIKLSSSFTGRYSASPPLRPIPIVDYRGKHIPR